MAEEEKTSEAGPESRKWPGDADAPLGLVRGDLGYAASEDERPSMSYWQIVLGQFRKNRLAVASFYVVAALFLIAVYAPVLSFRVPFVYVDGIRRSVSPGDRIEIGALAFTIDTETTAAGKGSVTRFYLKPAAAGERVHIREGMKIGSSPVCVLVDRSLKPVHARLGVFSGRPWIEDRSGEGGVKVNGAVPSETSFPFFSTLFNKNEFEMDVDRFFNLLQFAVPALLAAWLLWRWIARNRLKLNVRRTRLAGAMGALALLLGGYVWIAAFPSKAPYRDYLKELHEDGGSVSGWGLKLSGSNRWGLFPPIARSYRDQNLTIRLKGPGKTVPRASILSPFTGSRPAPEDAGSATLASSSFLAGTDSLGRDVFTRLLYGTRISLTIGIFAVAIYVMIGIFFGGLAGYFGGWVDILIMRFIEIMMCFPTFFLILTIISIFESRSIFLIMVIIGVTGWTGVARLVRGEFLKQRTIDYVTAARALGVSRPLIMFKHILPNAIAPVLVSATFGIAGAILTESGLSFLGLGDDRAPSWGQLLTDGRVSQEYYLILSAGFAIFFTVTILNLVGEGTRDALDPKLRK